MKILGEIEVEDSIIEEAVARAAKELSEEIDFSMLLNMYKEMGWTEVEFQNPMPMQRAKMIQDWLNENCKGHRISRGKRFLFEDVKEASWFILRWS